MNNSLYNGRVQNLVKGLLPLSNEVHPIKTNYYLKKDGNTVVETLEISIYKYAKIILKKLHHKQEDNLIGTFEFYNINRNKKNFEKKLCQGSRLINNIENLVIDKYGNVELQVEYVIESGDETITINRYFDSEAYKLFLRKVFFYLNETEKNSFKCYKKIKAEV